MFIFPLMKHIETNEEIEQMMNEKNMSCGEVITLADFAYDISQFEQDNDIFPLEDRVSVSYTHLTLPTIYSV